MPAQNRGALRVLHVDDRRLSGDGHRLLERADLEIRVHRRGEVRRQVDTVAHLTAGAAEALRWCKREGLTVVLVTNTLWRGDDEVREDWRRFGLADVIDGVASSHNVGWRKPHRAMFDRALELADARPDEAFMVGDRMRADVWGARQVGIRGILRRTPGLKPQTPVDVAPDAVVDSLAELPAVVSPWLDGG